MNRLRILGAAALRSITGVTGALIAGAASVAKVFGAVCAALVIGQPGSWIAFAIFLGIPINGGRSALIGALVGLVTHWFVRRTSFSGPVDRKMVLGGVILAVVVAAASGAYSVHRGELLNRPRVMQSDGRVSRSVASSLSETSKPAAVLYNRNPEAVTGLDWNNQRVVVAIEDQTLVLRRNAVEVDRVSLEAFKSVREVVSATAMLEGDNREWLAMNVRLHVTGGRELLLIYDPSGVRAYQELLARTNAGFGTVLWSSGEPGDRQQFILKMGELLRYGR